MENEMYFNLFYLILMLIEVLISMSFLTLFERKFLGYVQVRKGPNKLGIMGILQPFSDAVKLISNEMFYLNRVYLNFYLLMPMISLFLSLILWLMYPFFIDGIMGLEMLLILVILSMSVYPPMIGGWSSCCNYTMLGAIRAIAQSISYEVSLFLIIFCVILLSESFDFIEIIEFQGVNKFIFMVFPIYLIFLMSMLMELNRTPYDLVEGESELVSGFNTEYYSSMFTLLFMSEYLNIIFMSIISSILFFGGFMMSLFFLMVVIFHVILIVWVRGVLPRIRYDQLMFLCWKKFLSYSLMYIMMIMLIKELIKILIGG